MVSLMVSNANIHSSHLTQQSSATHCTFYFHFISFVQQIRKSNFGSNPCLTSFSLALTRPNISVHILL